MQGLQVTGGMVDGFHSKDNRNELGYYFGLQMATYTQNANKWVFGERKRSLTVLRFGIRMLLSMAVRLRWKWKRT
jgi:hypothetical protein